MKVTRNLELYYYYFAARLPGGKNKKKGKSSVQVHSIYMINVKLYR